MPELRLQHCRVDARYDILECLGRGSYAEIYKAHDNAAAEDLPQTVVIKALNLLLQEEPDSELARTLVANFQNEAVALDRVRHQYIISRLGHGTAIDLDGTEFHYIVLEYLPGGDMAALSRHNPLPIERVLGYLEQVCSGLAHAHACGVIHRDIKPQNLLLTVDKQTVKIADFGVARLDANEGAITRVGTNMYSAPEHNPLMHTDQLDLAALLTSPQHLTPAADIYSLAKTAYTLLAGEPPRKFSQRAITELPISIGEHYWVAPLVKVLERATQTRAEDRYQTVTEFWADLADAALRDTEDLPASPSVEALRKITADLDIQPEELTQAPPRPHFAVSQVAEPIAANVSPIQRPRIVVQVSQAQINQPAAAVAISASQPGASQFMTPFPLRPTVPAAQYLNGNALAQQQQRKPVRRSKVFLVAAGLVLAFSGMLLATHRYVTSHWNPLVSIPGVGSTFIVGREGVTTTDLNLRGDPGSDKPRVGLAEVGSRIRVLSVNDNWYQVQVLQHGRPKTDPYTLDKGWVNKKYLKLD
jgi:serine/threonine protein kinase